MAVQPIAFPLTHDATQGGPNYSASDFRFTAGAALAVPDGSAFGGIQGVRVGCPSPLVRISSTTVTVAEHVGWLCPWTGAGSYMYALPSPVQVAVGSTSGSYKIAVILEDKSAGHGTSEKVDVKVYPGYTLDSQIPGLVVARVDNGVASDVAPVISQDATIRVRTITQLQSVRAADGTQGVLADGSEYKMRSGSWSLTMKCGFFEGSTDGNGMYWVDVPSQPKQVFLQTATVGDDNRRFWWPVVWDISSTRVTIRIVDTRSNEWAGGQPARFFWRMYF